MTTERICSDCGRTFLSEKKKRLCPECKQRHNRENADRLREKQGKTKLTTFICEDCGKEFQKKNSQQKRCTECTYKRYHEPKMMKCERCGKEVQRKNRGQKYCTECAGIARREQSEAYNRKISEQRAAARTTRNCARCGAEFWPKVALQKYCTDCSIIKQHENANKAGKLRREEDWKVPSEERQTELICRCCGEKFYARNKQAYYCSKQCLENSKGRRRGGGTQKNNLWLLGEFAACNGMSYGSLTGHIDVFGELPPTARIENVPKAERNQIKKATRNGISIGELLSMRKIKEQR